MTKDLGEYLIKKYPKLYTECSGETAFKLFGFECKDGWFRIILWLSRYLQDYVDQQNEMSSKYPDQYQPVDQIKVVQVKEKFGTLRFYYKGGNEHIRAVVDFVEYISGYVCETTGEVDNVGYNRKGYIQTKNHLCENINKKDFFYVDDEELRSLIDKKKDRQLTLNL